MPKHAEQPRKKHALAGNHEGSLLLSSEAKTTPAAEVSCNLRALPTLPAYESSG